MKKKRNEPIQTIKVYQSTLKSLRFLKWYYNTDETQQEILDRLVQAEAERGAKEFLERVKVEPRTLSENEPNSLWLETILALKRGKTLPVIDELHSEGTGIE